MARGSRVSFRLEAPALLPLVLLAAVGWLEAGLNGLIAGVAVWAFASMASLLGMIPVIGQVIYWPVYRMFEESLLALVHVPLTLSIGYWYGLATSILISIFVAAWVVKGGED